LDIDRRYVVSGRRRYDLRATTVGTDTAHGVDCGPSRPTSGACNVSLRCKPT
jgi:hypothetical protein